MIIEGPDGFISACRSLANPGWYEIMIGGGRKVDPREGEYRWRRLRIYQVRRLSIEWVNVVTADGRTWLQAACLRTPVGCVARFKRVDFSTGRTIVLKRWEWPASFRAVEWRGSSTTALIDP